MPVAQASASRSDGSPDMPRWSTSAMTSITRLPSTPPLPKAAPLYGGSAALHRVLSPSTAPRSRPSSATSTRPGRPSSAASVRSRPGSSASLRAPNASPGFARSQSATLARPSSRAAAAASQPLRGAASAAWDERNVGSTFRPPPAVTFVALTAPDLSVTLAAAAPAPAAAAPAVAARKHVPRSEPVKLCPADQRLDRWLETIYRGAMVRGVHGMMDLATPPAPVRRAASPTALTATPPALPLPAPVAVPASTTPRGSPRAPPRVSREDAAAARLQARLICLRHHHILLHLHHPHLLLLLSHHRHRPHRGRRACAARRGAASWSGASGTGPRGRCGGASSAQ